MATSLQIYMDANPGKGPVESAVEVIKTAIAAASFDLSGSTINVDAVSIKDPVTSATKATVGANGLYTEVRVSALPSGAATSSAQTTAQTSLTSLLAKDFATQTTLAAVLAKLTSDPSTQTTSAAILAKLIANPATDTLQTTGNTSLASILTALQGSVKVNPGSGSFTDRSGTVTTGGVSQQVAATNASRIYFLFQNNSATDLWLNFGVAAVANQPSIKVKSGGDYILEDGFVSTQAVNVFGATTGQAFTAKEA